MMSRMSLRDRILRDLGDPSWFSAGVFYLIGIPFGVGLIGAVAGAGLGNPGIGGTVGLGLGLVLWLILFLWAARRQRLRGYVGRRRVE